MRIIWKRRPVSRPPPPYLTCRTVPPRKKMAARWKTAPEGAIMTLIRISEKSIVPPPGRKSVIRSGFRPELFPGKGSPKMALSPGQIRKK